MSRDIPRHIVETFGSARKFRAHHRESLRRAARALEEARRGCNYSPAVDDIHIAVTALSHALERTSPRLWENRRYRAKRAAPPANEGERKP